MVQKAKAHKRAGAITAASIIFWIYGVLGIAIAVYFGMVLEASIRYGLEIKGFTTTTIFAIFSFVIAIAYIVAGIGLFGSKKWAGVLGIDASIVNVFLNLILHPALGLVFLLFFAIPCILVLVAWKSLS